MHDFDFGVIGGGAAGLTAAAGAARLGLKTLLVEREGRLGGDCLHYGCVPSKTLIKTAKVRRHMARAAEFGLPEIQLPPVDFRMVRARIETVISVIQKHDSVERFCSLGAKVEFGQARFVDEHVIELNGRRISAAKWLIATGSNPAVPELPGLKDAGFLTNKDVFYMDRLPESLVVLGGGPIAVEMAQAFRRLGSRVALIQRGGQILSKEDKDMADAVLEALQAEGVDVRLNARATRVEAFGGKTKIFFECKDGGEDFLFTESILVAQGRAVGVDGLGLENAGVRFEKSGIPVDARMRTNQSHIFAAGDVTGKYQFTHAAGYEAGIALANVAFRLPRKADYKWLPWCTFCDPELASIGLNEKRAAEQGITVRPIIQEFRANDRALAEGEGVGKLKLLLDDKDRPVGVQIVGPGAGELLGEWSAALAGGLRLSTLAGAVHAYPTLAEINKAAAGTVIGEKLFSPIVQKGLALFFNYKGRACG